MGRSRLKQTSNKNKNLKRGKKVADSDDNSSKEGVETEENDADTGPDVPKKIADVRSGTKPTDAPEGEILSAVEKMKASVDKNATPQQKAEAATKWTTDDMLNQAYAEKKAKAAEERSITAQKQGTVPMNDSKLA